MSIPSEVSGVATDDATRPDDSAMVGALALPLRDLAGDWRVDRRGRTSDLRFTRYSEQGALKFKIGHTAGGGIPA